MLMTYITDAMETLAMGHQVRKSKSILATRRENTTSKMSLPDATEYYKRYQNNENSSKTFNLDLIGDSYIGISKLLQIEYRFYEKRDSAILQKNLSMSLKKRSSSSSKLKKNDSFQAKMDLSSSGNETTLRRKTNSDRKAFKEQLWSSGKVIGKIKGHFQFLNLPIMQQMSLGTLTENGIMMNAAPIIIEEKDGTFMSFMRKN